jgi:hypothetical protein
MTQLNATTASTFEVEATAGYDFIAGSMERHEFRFAKIVDWIRRHSKPLRKTDHD